MVCTNDALNYRMKELKTKMKCYNFFFNNRYNSNNTVVQSIHSKKLEMVLKINEIWLPWLFTQTRINEMFNVRVQEVENCVLTYVITLLLFLFANVSQIMSFTSYIWNFKASSRFSRDVLSYRWNCLHFWQACDTKWFGPRTSAPWKSLRKLIYSHLMILFHTISNH